jgi:hypothetical protein
LRAEITPGNLEHSCATLRAAQFGRWCGLGADDVAPEAGLVGAGGLGGPDVAAGLAADSPGADHRNTHQSLPSITSR